MRERKSAEAPKKSWASRVVFDHYNIPMGPECINAEYPKGKKVFHDRTDNDNVVFDDFSKEVAKINRGVKIFPHRMRDSVDLH